MFGSVALLLIILVVPGIVVGAAAGLRGWLLVGSAPLTTYGVFAIAGPVVPVVFGRWSPWAFALCVLVVAAALFGVRLLVRTRTATFEVPAAAPTRWSVQQHAGVAAAVLATTALGLFVLSRATDGFTAVHQFWDATFHANAVRFIADTGESGASALAAINGADSSGFFYPNTFHVQLATALMAGDLPLVELINVQVGLMAGLFALSLVTLVRVTSSRPALAFAAAVVCGAFSSFPYDLAYFGPLWPFAMGVALMPGFLALFVAALERPHPSTVLVGALGMIAMVAVHPSIALAAVVLAVGFLAQRWLTLRTLPRTDLVVLAGAGLAAALYGVPVVLAANRTASSLVVDWPVIGPAGGALGQLVFLNHDSATPQWWLVAAMLLGLVGLRTLRPLAWWLAGSVVFAGLFVLSASYEGRLVRLLTDPWWNDRWRFVALCVPALALLAAGGLVYLRDAVVAPLTARLPRLREPLLRAAVLVAVAALLAGLTDGMYRARNVGRVAAAYTDGPMLSDQERAALGELAKLAGPDDRVMNDPNDGSPWMWALDDVHPVFGHALVYGNPVGIDEDRRTLYYRFDDLDTDQEVREIVLRLGIDYVFVGEGFASPNSRRIPGLDDLDDLSSVDEVFANDAARIYRVRIDELAGS